MKLAFCLFKYFPFGGLQRDFMRIAAACLQRGHTVDVFAMAWEGPLPTDVSLHIINVSGWQNHTRTQAFAAHVQAMTKSYDLVVGFNKMPGLDVYYAADTCYQAKARAQRSAVYRLLPRYKQWVAAEQAVFSTDSQTQILLIAERQQAEFQRYYGTQADRFHLLPPGIARDRIRPDGADVIRQATRRMLKLKEDDLILLAIGSGFKTKGLDRTLLALSALPLALKQRTHLLVVGKDNPARFQRDAKRYGVADRVTFLGGRDDIPELLLAGDLLIHPAYNENTGTVLLEALASGLPVLTTDVCGYAHYVTSANAGSVLSSPFQQNSFNQVLEDMLSSDQRLIWQTNAVNFCRDADIYNMPERVVDYLTLFAERSKK